MANRSGISRRTFMTMGACAAAFAASTGARRNALGESRQMSAAMQGSQKASDTPNIIVIMTDQQRADFSKAEGFPLDCTPALDHAACNGVRFNRAYTSSPVCAPARVSMFTGRFPSSHGLRANYMPEGGVRYKTDLMDIVKNAGYDTALIGKNHSHRGSELFDFFRKYDHDGGYFRDAHTEQDKAFQEWLTLENHWISEKPTPFPLDCQNAVRIVDDAIVYLKEPRIKPFFLWMSIPEPHNPYQVPEPYWDMFPPDSVPPRAAGPEILESKGYPWVFERNLIEHYHPGYDQLWRRYRSNYCGLIRMIDDQLARFFTFMDESRLSERTLILFVSDHGDYAGDYGLVRKGVGVPECLVRVPMIWTGPGICPRKEFHPAHVSIVDVLPTLCEAIGQEIPEGVQGRSLWPLLTGADYPEAEFASIYAEHGLGGRAWTEADHTPFDAPTFNFAPQLTRPTFQELNNLTQSGKRRMVRKGDWKFSMDLHWGNGLYNVAEDPGELHNRFGDAAVKDIQAELALELLRWKTYVDDDLPPGIYENRRNPHNWQFSST